MSESPSFSILVPQTVSPQPQPPTDSVCSGSDMPIELQTMSSSTVVVLFYRYFLPTPLPPPEGDKSSSTSSADGAVLDEATLRLFQKHSLYYLPLLQKFQVDLCKRLGNVKGRILISQEGINGTLSFPSRKELRAYVDEIEAFDLLREMGVPPTSNNYGISDDNEANSVPEAGRGRFFMNIDWKISTVDNHRRTMDLDSPKSQSEPFPDLFIHIVKEVVNTGGTIDVSDIPRDTGKEISAEEFHQILLEAQNNDGGVMASNEGGKEISNTAKYREGCEPMDEQPGSEKKEVVLIDVRNTFEHSIGHFLHPHSDTITPVIAAEKDEPISQSSLSGNALQAENSDVTSPDMQPTPALNPNTVTFSHFDSNFCAKYSDTLKNKKVLMYCTGGIRCVKASAMLKQRGVEDVSHLSGGIHRYVEKYGSKGFYKGKVFVFDQRVALNPDAMVSKTAAEDEKEPKKDAEGDEHIVGKCIECHKPEDQISGANLCTVCRDLVLICQTCKSSINEYYCERHYTWKDIYVTFLERFSLEELQTQLEQLQKMHDTIYVPARDHKNVRRTLRKQIDKVRSRIDNLKDGKAKVETNTKRRCRTCFESEDICDGLCWGFWRSLQSSHQIKENNNSELEPILAVKVGDRVTPGPDWNELRYGSRYQDHESRSKKKMRSDTSTCTSKQSQSTTSIIKKMKMGTVVEIKPWASGTEMDCVSVLWDVDETSSHERRRGKRKGRGDKQFSKDEDTILQSEIYRWGAVARNGKRMYDVKLLS